MLYLSDDFSFVYSALVDILAVFVFFKSKSTIFFFKMRFIMIKSQYALKNLVHDVIAFDVVKFIILLVSLIYSPRYHSTAKSSILRFSDKP